MIKEIENTTITDYTTYQKPKNNLKNLIGNQEKMKNVIVNDDRYFGTGYWLARKDCFSKKTQEKLQTLTDQEVQNVNDKKENRTYLRIQDKEQQIHDDGIKKLAELTTNELKSRGYDGIYFRESDTQEGELVVFDKEKEKIVEIRAIENKIVQDKNSFTKKSEELEKIKSDILNLFIKSEEIGVS